MSQTPVTEIMTAPVLTVESEAHITEIAAAMRTEEINSIVVVNDDCTPTGLLTATDFVAIVATEGVDPETTVGDWTATDVLTVAPDTTVAKAAARMVEAEVTHLPVVGENVDGIVTATDVTAHFADQQRA